jgi:hypothetical protein
VLAWFIATRARLFISLSSDALFNARDMNQDAIKNKFQKILRRLIYDINGWRNLPIAYH